VDDLVEGKGSLVKFVVVPSRVAGLILVWLLGKWRSHVSSLIQELMALLEAELDLSNLKCCAGDQGW
jgi:hypothetical protein